MIKTGDNGARNQLTVDGEASGYMVRLRGGRQWLKTRRKWLKVIKNVQKWSKLVTGDRK
jgi:hypothetical protein